MDQLYSFEAYRPAFAPLHWAQQEGLNVIGRLARFQCTLALDFLEHNLAGVQAMVSAATPTEYLAKQGELYVHFIEKVATRTQEFLKDAAVKNAPEIAGAPTVDDANDFAVTASPEEEEEQKEDVERKVAQLLEEGENLKYQAAAEVHIVATSPPKATSAVTKQGRRRSGKPGR